MAKRGKSAKRECVYEVIADANDTPALIDGFIAAIKLLGGEVKEREDCEGSSTFGFDVYGPKVTK